MRGFYIMFTRITSEFGVLTYSDTMVEQLIQKAFAPYKDQCWPGRFVEGGADAARSGKLDSPGVLTAEVNEKGVLIRICVVMRFGVPIRKTLEDIIQSLASSITESLELPLDNIILKVTAVAAKGTSARDISLDYYGKFINTKD